MALCWLVVVLSLPSRGSPAVPHPSGRAGVRPSPKAPGVGRGLPRLRYDLGGDFGRAGGAAFLSVECRLEFERRSHRCGGEFLRPHEAHYRLARLCRRQLDFRAFAVFVDERDAHRIAPGVVVEEVRAGDREAGVLLHLAVFAAARGDRLEPRNKRKVRDIRPREICLRENELVLRNF